MMKQLLFLIAFVCAGFYAGAQTHSVLSQGSWVKISTEEAGIYRLTYSDLKEMGVDVENLSSDKMNLYGMAAGAIKEDYSDDFVYDLQKMAILIDDSGDGTFDQGDYILFYGEGPVTWYYDPGMKSYRHNTNPYCNKVYYYLRTDDSDPKRIEIQDTGSQTPTDTISWLSLSVLHEKELYNPLNSGRTWVGEMFDDTTERVYNYNYEGDVIKGGKLYFAFGTNATENGAFKVYLNNVLIDSITTFITPDNGMYAYRMQYDTVDIPEAGNALQLKFVFDKPNDSAIAYLDYFELNLNKMPVITDPSKSIEIKSAEAIDEGVYFYRLENAQNYHYVWDVTDPLNVSLMKSQVSGDVLTFVDNRPARKYFLFNFAPGYKTLLNNGTKKMFWIAGSNDLPKPELLGIVENQDIIGSEPAGLIIITNNKLEDAAKELLLYHQEHDNVTAQVYKIAQVYNEFSAGRRDPAAIRNLLALKLKQSGKESRPEYLLLLGSASFDYRSIKYTEQPEMVPTYESLSSGSLTKSFSDDMFYSFINDGYQVSVGRLPAYNSEVATDMVDKIKHYGTSSSYSTWKNQISLIADNSDNGVHSMQQDKVSDVILDEQANIVQNKLYLSLFEASENGYPQVNQLLKTALSDGRFFISFTGHSSYHALTKENIFDTEDASQLENIDKLPVWISGGAGTACYDDPGITSLGTTLLKNKNGGAIVYIGNTGMAFSSINGQNTTRFSEYFFDTDHKTNSVGDAFLAVFKENRFPPTNHWNLIGDPVIKPLWPVNNVQTDSINGTATALFNDTIAPGSTIKIKGRITDENGNLVSSFNGKVRITIYDMPYVKLTVEGDFDPVREITLYDSLLTEKCVDVTDGLFNGQLIMPAKYHEAYGNLNISYYGFSQNIDAAGNLNSVMYGGEPSGLNEDPALTGLKAYPVPFNKNIMLSVPASFMQQKLNIYMTDAAGKTVYRTVLNRNTLSGRVSLDIPDLPDGIYLLNVTGEKGSKVFKMVKEQGR
jgi:hypothetical protein